MNYYEKRTFEELIKISKSETKEKKEIKYKFKELLENKIKLDEKILEEDRLNLFKIIDKEYSKNTNLLDVYRLVVFVITLNKFNLSLIPKN